MVDRQRKLVVAALVRDGAGRVLLTQRRANQPMPLQHIREQLREWCPSGRCQWLLMPLDVMRQVVERDQAYGLKRYEQPDVA